MSPKCHSVLHVKKDSREPKVSHNVGRANSQKGLVFSTEEGSAKANALANGPSVSEHALV